MSGFTKPMDNYFTCKIMTSVCTMFSSDSEITNMARKIIPCVTDLASPATLSTILKCFRLWIHPCQVGSFYMNRKIESTPRHGQGILRDRNLKLGSINTWKGYRCKEIFYWLERYLIACWGEKRKAFKLVKWQGGRPNWQALVEYWATLTPQGRMSWKRDNCQCGGCRGQWEAGQKNRSKHIFVRKHTWPCGPGKKLPNRLFPCGIVRHIPKLIIFTFSV